jgi:hypothetical protein
VVSEEAGGHFGKVRPDGLIVVWLKCIRKFYMAGEVAPLVARVLHVLEFFNIFWLFLIIF